MKSPLLHRRHDAFSLVEMMVAAAILALVVVGFYVTFGGANNLAVQSRLINSSKVILGAALNETLASHWQAGTTPEVVRAPFDTVIPYSTQNEGKNAKPAARTDTTPGGTRTNGDGVVGLFTGPDNGEVVIGYLDRIVHEIPERSDLRSVTFQIKYFYQGKWSTTYEARTVVARDN